MVTVSNILIIGINTAKNSEQSKQADLDPIQMQPSPLEQKSHASPSTGEHILSK